MGRTHWVAELIGGDGFSVVLPLEAQPCGGFDSQAFLQLCTVGPHLLLWASGLGVLPSAQESAASPPRPWEPVLVGVGGPTGRDSVCPAHFECEHPQGQLRVPVVLPRPLCSHCV